MTPPARPPLGMVVQLTPIRPEGLVLDKAACEHCAAEYVTQAQVDWWPHLDRYRRGVAGLCVECTAPPCLRCGTVAGSRRPGVARPDRNRGLCKRCHGALQGTDDLYDFPRQTRPADDVLDDWLHIDGPQIGLTLAAERLGMKRNTLERAIIRAAKRGDPRALRRRVG